MRNTITIFRREMASYFATPVAYVFIVIFLACCGIGILALIALSIYDTSNPPQRAELVERKPVEPGPVDDDAPEEFTATESGLKYRIRRKSDGTKPAATDMVVAHYRGWMEDGTTFDSSYQRGEPTPFGLDGVIPGWTEGLQLIGEGGMIELEIPGDLAYGAAPPPRSGIPPNATLHFLVELIEVRKPPSPGTAPAPR